MSKPRKMAYLVSLYPAISHTFILREIRLLRRMGHEIVTASINRADLRQMGVEEEQEAQKTFFVKDEGVWGGLKALLYWLVKSPARLLHMLLAAPSLGRHGQWWMGFAYAVEAALVARWMEREGAHLLHVHFGNAAASVGVLAKRLMGCHLSFTIHGPDEFDDVLGQHLRRKMAEVDEVICISKNVHAQLMRLSDPKDWHKLYVCRLGVDLEQHSFAMRASSSGMTQLLCVGRLAPAKGQLVLLHALLQLRSQGLCFHLTLVGDGPDRARIEGEIARWDLTPHVSLTGALPQAQVRELMELADVFVLPSLAEGIPVVLMEAMACGLPCVSTPVNGIPELIGSEHMGLLATPGDAHALAEKLRELITRPRLRQSVAMGAYVKLARDYDLHRNVGQLSRHFRSFPRQTACSDRVATAPSGSAA